MICVAVVIYCQNKLKDNFENVKIAYECKLTGPLPTYKQHT